MRLELADSLQGIRACCVHEMPAVVMSKEQGALNSICKPASAHPCVDLHVERLLHCPVQASSHAWIQACADVIPCRFVFQCACRLCGLQRHNWPLKTTSSLQRNTVYGCCANHRSRKCWWRPCRPWQLPGTFASPSCQATCMLPQLHSSTATPRSRISAGKPDFCLSLQLFEPGHLLKSADLLKSPLKLSQ